LSLCGVEVAPRPLDKRPIEEDPETPGRVQLLANSGLLGRLHVTLNRRHRARSRESFGLIHSHNAPSPAAASGVFAPDHPYGSPDRSNLTDSRFVARRSWRICGVHYALASNVPSGQALEQDPVACGCFIESPDAQSRYSEDSWPTDARAGRGEDAVASVPVFAHRSLTTAQTWPVCRGRPRPVTVKPGRR